MEMTSLDSPSSNFNAISSFLLPFMVLAYSRAVRVERFSSKINVRPSKTNNDDSLCGLRNDGVGRFQEIAYN
jgi:hypothetical protein